MDDNPLDDDLREMYFEKYEPIAVPCPNCGGEVIMGCCYDWPSMHGGTYVEDQCHCSKCGAEWTADDAPPEFSTPDGQYWNVVLPPGETLDGSAAPGA